MLFVKSVDGTKTEPLNSKGFKTFSIKQSISGELTLNFSVIKEDRNPGHTLLEPQAKVNINGYEFTVKNYSENAYTKTVTALSTFFELRGNLVKGLFVGQPTLINQIQYVLANTGWTILIDPTIQNLRITIEDLGNENSIAALEKIKASYGIEYLIQPNNIVYFAREIGTDNDYVYRYKHNINEVVLAQDTSNLFTTVEGFGADGLRERYTSPNVAIFGVLEADPIRDERFTNRENLLEYLKSSIQDVPELVISSNVPELNTRMIGERVWLNYEPLNINMKMRIVEQTLSLKNDELYSTNVVLGNTIYGGLRDTIVKQQQAINSNNKAIEDAIADYNQKIKDAINGLELEIQIAANGKNTIYSGVTEPDITLANDNDLWYKPLGNGETQMFIFENNQWNLVADTSDVTAVEREVEEAKEEAEAALTAAEAADQKATTAQNSANTALANAQTAFDNAQEALEREFRPVNKLRLTNQQSYTTIGNTTSVTYNSLGNDFYSAVALSPNTTGNLGITTPPQNRTSQLIQGQEYTLSFKAKASTSMQLNYLFLVTTTNDNQRVPHTGADNVVTTEFKEFKFTFVNTRPNNTTAGITVATEVTRPANTTLEVKDIALHEGKEAFQWYPAPEDIGYQFAQFKVFNDSIAARVSGTEGNVTTLTATVNGLQTTVAQKVDQTTYNSYVTQTAQVLNSKLSSTDAAATYATQSSLTQTSNSLISRIENIQVGGVNMYEGTQNFNGSNWVNLGLWENSGTYNGLLVKRRNGFFSGLGQYVPLVQGQQYTFSFYAKADANIGTLTVYGSGPGNTPNAFVPGVVINGVTSDWKRFSVTFTSLVTNNISVRLEKLGNASANAFLYVAGLKLETGNKATDWDISPLDVSSQITQLNDNINLKVSKNDVINQLNISTEGILIAANRIRITGQTTIDDASITSAKIASLDAAKITAGTLNAANVNIINMNASNITAGTLNVARLGAGQLTGNTIKTSNTVNYVQLENQFVDFYNEGQRKLNIGFDLNTADGNYFPVMRFGAGDQNGRNKGTIMKTSQLFGIRYSIPNSAGGGTSLIDFENDGEIGISTPKNIRMAANTIELSQATQNIGYVKSNTTGLELTRSTTQTNRIVVRLNGTDLGYLQIL